MPGDKKTILIIDDDPLIRDLYSTKLQQAGFEVVQAADGERGLAEALASKPDLIVLDMLMPGMSGAEVLKKLRADHSWGMQVPVIVLTNDKLDRDGNLAAITSTSPAYFLQKATTMPADLVALIKDLFGK